MKMTAHIEIFLALSIFIFLLGIALSTNTTGNSGDSVTHYLFSRYAFKYPQFFLHHWAKPVFVLLTSAFSQFGFKGIMVFNCLCASLAAFFTVRTAKLLKIRNSLLVYLIIFSSPLYFKMIFSGLTEYLFALFLIVGIYLFCNTKYITSLAIVSFLPMIRSEGLLILGVFGIALLVIRKYSLLPFLTIGQVVYSVIGTFYYRDVLWVFNRIPYAGSGSHYGKGELLDFFHRLNYVIEKPIYIFLIIGILGISVRYFLQDRNIGQNIGTYLVLSSFLVIFIAHSIFWWLGMFGSMGLPRVLNAVVPMIAILALKGIQDVLGRFQNLTIRGILLVVFSCIIFLYPYSPRSQGVVYNWKLFDVEEHSLINEEVVPYIERKFSNYSNSRVYFSHPYLSLALHIDHFDNQRHQELQLLHPDSCPEDAIIIWDDWFSVVEAGVNLENLKGRFELLKVFERHENNRLIKFVVLKPRASLASR